jgi:hypothetical protein
MVTWKTSLHTYRPRAIEEAFHLSPPHVRKLEKLLERFFLLLPFLLLSLFLLKLVDARLTVIAGSAEDRTQLLEDLRMGTLGYRNESRGIINLLKQGSEFSHISLP